MTIGLERQPEFLHQNNNGSVEVIVGPMFSGKSDRLIYILRQAIYARHKVQAFKPIKDDRRGEDTINTYDGISFPATQVGSSEDILTSLEPGVDVIGIDEGNFFDMNLTEVCKKLASSGKHVLIAGLHSDFRGEPFGPMADLLVDADYVEKRHARCGTCGHAASRTQRIIRSPNGEKRPAFYDDPQIVVGGEEMYEARCRHHHEVPHREEAEKNG